MKPRRTLVAVLATATVSVVVGCGGDDGPEEVDPDTAPTTLAGGSEGIYLGTYGAEVRLLDADDGDVLAVATLDDVVSGLAVAGGSVYATIDIADNDRPDLVVRLDATTLEEQARVEITSVGGMSVAVGPIAASESAVVVGDFDNVVVLDPATLDQRGRTDDLPGIVEATAAGGDHAYAVTSSTLYDLDPATGEIVTEREVSDGPVDECGLSADPDGVWLAGTRSAGRYGAGSLDALADVEGIEHSQAVIATDGGGALLRATTADGSQVLTLAADGAVESRTDMPGGECLARGGDSDKVWGRFAGILVTVEID